MITLPADMETHTARVKVVEINDEELFRKKEVLAHPKAKAVRTKVNKYLKKYLCGKKGVEKIVQDENLKKFALQQNCKDVNI